MNNSQAVRIICRLSTKRLEEVVEYLAMVLQKRKGSPINRCLGCGRTIRSEDRQFAGFRTSHCETCIASILFDGLGES